MRETMNSQAETTLNHFSHPHPLQLTNNQNIYNSSATCSGCCLQVSGMIYSCRICNYFLHADCAKMPKQITHPFDKGHVLTLHSRPPYDQEGLDVYCDACGKPGQGFEYHCKICQIDLHILCAAMPLTFTNQSHPHQLNLIFSPTHLDKTFNCDVCNTLGSDHWLYRCHACDFDVHLHCRNVPVQQPVQQPNVPNQYAEHHQPGFAYTTKSTPPPPPPPQVHHHQPPQFSQNFYQTHHVQPGIPVVNHPNQGMADSHAAVMAYIARLEQELVAVQHRMNQQQLQALHQLQAFNAGGGRYGGFGGRTGGGAGGGFGGMSNLIQSLSGGFGQGIGGNIPGLDLFGNGGGSVGGFGGVDFGSLLGDGGGFGNLDFGSLLGGGFGFS
ncbi:OLC1v1001665C1 [Oldenlandia corymbosa var. corymbosa]|uniref:OLC1v1001665C1 n=1 Tax=Oldenlandia corymbosa var. corymbosa TaxID=529605 RepID=A0AAV1D8P9_OLDCO|nr:OLC1v1001665C1 [Oldenlandia corymbosa var. corymbosa]